MKNFEVWFKTLKELKIQLIEHGFTKEEHDAQVQQIGSAARCREFRQNNKSRGFVVIFTTRPLFFAQNIQGL